MILPLETTCPHCGTVAAEATCHVCKEDRPGLVALKSISRKMAEQAQVLTECRYYSGQACNCEGRGHCLGEAA